MNIPNTIDHLREYRKQIDRHETALNLSEIFSQSEKMEINRIYNLLDAIMVKKLNALQFSIYTNQ